MILRAYLLLVLGVLVQCSLHPTNSAAKIHLSAVPPTLHEGFTPELTLNCTFSHDGSDFGLINLIVSKAEGTGVYTVMAEVRYNSPSSVSVQESYGASVSGEMNVTGDSFIEYIWSNPSKAVLGEYLCEAYIIDNHGQPMVSKVNVVVGERIVGVDGVLAILKDMKLTHSLEINQLKAELSNQTNSNIALVNWLSTQDQEINQLKSELTNQTNSNMNLIQSLSTQDKEINKLKSELNSQNISNMDFIQKLNAELNNLTNTNIDLANSLSTQDNDIQKLKAEQGKETNNTDIALVEYFSTQAKEIQKLNAELQNQTVINIALTNSLTIQDKDIQKLKAEQNNQMNTCMHVMNSLSAQADQIQELKNEQNNYTNTNMALMNDLSTQEKEIENLKKLDSQQEITSNLGSFLNRSYQGLFMATTKLNNISYSLSKPVFWDQAASDSVCRFRGGHLAEVNDNTEYSFIVEFLKRENTWPSSWVMLGATDNTLEGKWLYMDHRASANQSVGFFKWGIHQPDGNREQNCMFIMPISYEMGDRPCDGWMQFLCETPQV